MVAPGAFSVLLSRLVLFWVYGRRLTDQPFHLLAKLGEPCIFQLHFCGIYFTTHVFIHLTFLIDCRIRTIKLMDYAAAFKKCGRNLAHFREEQRLSISALAALSNLEPETVQEWHV